MSHDVLSGMLGIRIRPGWSAAIRTVTVAIFLFVAFNAYGNWAGYWHGNYSSSQHFWKQCEVKIIAKLSSSDAVTDRCLAHCFVVLPFHWMLLIFFAFVHRRFSMGARSRRSGIHDVILPFEMPGAHAGRGQSHLPPFMTTVVTSTCAAVACTLFSTFTFLAQMNSIPAGGEPQIVPEFESADVDAVREAAIVLTSMLAAGSTLFSGFVVYRTISANGFRKELAGVAIVIVLQFSIGVLSYGVPNSDPLSCVFFVVFHAVAQFGSLVLLIGLFHRIESGY